MKRNKIDFKSVRYKLFTRILIVLIIVFVLLWLLEIFLYDNVYRNIMSKQVHDLDEEIVSLYTQDKTDKIENICEKKNLNVVVFKTYGFNYDILYSTSKKFEDLNNRLILRNVVSNLENQNSTYHYENIDDLENFICGRTIKVGEENIYFLTSAVVTPIDQTKTVNTFVLLISTITGLLIALFISRIFSHEITRPIHNLSNKAKELSKGNRNINFDSLEYSEVKILSNSLNYAVKEINKSDQLQKEVIQNVSHELRTPLTMIKSYTEMLQDFSKNDEKKRDEHLAIIKEQADKLEGLVNDMIDLSKLKSQTMVFNKTEFNLSESVKKLQDYYVNKFKDFTFDFDIEDNVIIFADQQRIEQVVINLINNAINYSQEQKDIKVKLFNDNGTYNLEVEDKGIGISEEDLENVFDRHFRANSTRKATTGSGVGLSIVKEILEHHGFKYGVESKLNVGSKFYIKFNQQNIELK